MTNPETQHPYRSAPSLDTDRLCIPYRGETRMRLSLSSGFANGRIAIDPAATDLVAIRCGDDLRPRLRVWTDEIAVSHHVTFGDWLRSMVRPADREMRIVLHPAVTWTLAIHGGLCAAAVDLTAGSVAYIEISGGCSEARFDLPVAKLATPIQISGGASRVRVHRPAETGVAFAASGGVATLRLDDDRFDAIGGAVQLSTRNLATSSTHYDLAITGGACDVAIERALQPAGVATSRTM